MEDVLQFSDLLGRLVDEHPADRIGAGDLVAVIGERSLGALLLLFALPNMLPLLPGMSLLTAIPLILISAQMLGGRHQPWLPAWLMRQSIATATLRKGLPRVQMLLRPVERLVRPRMTAVTGHGGTRLIGAITLLLSLIAWLPVIGLHYLPALLIAVFGIALINRDGVLALAAAVASVVSTVILSGLILAGGNMLFHYAQAHLA